MKVTLLQQDIVWANPAANRAAAGKAIEAAPPSDLYVLPEMWSTGFAVQPEGIAEPEQSESLQWMQDIASRMDAAIAGSIGVCTEEGYRNRLYFVKPGGDMAFYDKHHLFGYGGEHLHYTAGQERIVEEWRGVRFLLQVCYDLRFPVWSRSREDYDAIIYVANWPTSRQEAWRTLLKARAIENQCYVLGVNRVGTDPIWQYSGGTAFVDPYGRAEECSDNEVAALTAEINMERLNDFRRKFPVLKDRDNW